MKSIKYIISTILLLGSIVSSAQYQFQVQWCPPWVNPNNPTNECIESTYMSATVNTPNKSQVSVDQWVSNDWTQNTKTQMIGLWQGQYGNRLTVEGEATVKYNCHAYAWAGNLGVWMNSGNIFDPRAEVSKYWTDSSYVEVPNPSAGTKVSFGGPCNAIVNGRLVDECDHSAITTSSAGYLSSKWGNAPRFKHKIADCPYSIADLHYYARPVISGPSSSLNWGSYNTFSVTCAPGGFTWGSSSNLTVSSSGSGTTATVYPTGCGNSGWVSINYGGREWTRENVMIAGLEVQISDQLWPYGDVGISLPASLSAGATYQFGLTPTSTSVLTHYGTNYSYAWVDFSVPGIYLLYAKVTNTCGFQDGEYYLFAYPNVPSNSNSAYPNPVSDILNVDLGHTANSRSNIAGQTVTSSKAIKLDPVYDIRLYDGQGNLLRQRKSKTDTVQFNVSNLPNGIYYLHIYDDSGSKPIMETIVVEH